MLRPFTEDELAAWQAQEDKLNAREDVLSTWLEDHGYSHWTECSAPKCHERPVFHASYRYVTGRAGRISRSDKLYCQTHGERFAAKHGLLTGAANSHARPGS